MAEPQPQGPGPGPPSLRGRGGLRRSGGGPLKPRPSEVEILGVRFHDLDRSEAARAIADMARDGRKGYVVKPYSEFMPAAVGDPGVRRILNGADLCLADGVGIVWAAHYLGLRGRAARALLQLPWSLLRLALDRRGMPRPLRQHMAGVDLTWEMLAGLDAVGATVFLLGGTDAESAGARRAIEAAMPALRVVGARNGYFDVAGEENDRVVAAIDASGADVVLVAMGFPRQERWIAENLPRMRATVAVAEGGSFSFISGAAPRAPGWVRRAGLEWLYRLAREPRRLRRQAAIPAFLRLVVAERLRRSGTV